MTPAGRILVLDTATTRAALAVADGAGIVLAADAWSAGYRHGEELLPRIERLLAGAGIGRSAVTGIVVGTGPGAFTGLRVGLATAKGLAHALGLPIAGVATSAALLAAAGAAEHPTALLLPAGPADRVLCRHAEPARLLPGGEEPDLRDGEALVAVDLAGRAPEDALARGTLAREGLAAMLARLGAARLADAPDDLARLVPEYVTLPRGVLVALPDEAVRVGGTA